VGLFAAAHPWYDRLLDAVGAAGTVVGAVLAALGLAALIKTIYRRTVGRRRDLYRRIARLGTNAQVSFFTSVLGQPPAIQRSRNEQFVEYVFVDQDYFVNVLADREQSVRLFSVTTRRRKFQPRLESAKEGHANPRLEVRLGETTFAELGLSPDRAVGRGAGGRGFRYSEVFYLGNPGKYQTFVCSTGLGGAGAIEELPGSGDFDTGEILSERPAENHPGLKSFRASSRIEIFTVVAPSGIGDLDDAHESGPDLDHVRTLP